MSNKTSFIYNGNLFPDDAKIISPNSRAFKYGDGFFETMKMINGNIIFEELHFERLFSSLQTLQFDTPTYFTKEHLLQQTKELVIKNNHQSLSRIRLTIFRGDGFLTDESNATNYTIQSTALSSFPTYNEQGLTVNVYWGADKSCDQFSNIKSNNYLPSAMAAIWGKKNGLDDVLLRNCHHRIAEATTSNVFIVKNGIIKTPLLREGCVAGITRQYLLPCFERENLTVVQTSLTEREIYDADEVFLTNTGFYMQWVKQCGTKFYTNETSKQLYKQFILPLLK